jgi:hypothetical protein
VEIYNAKRELADWIRRKLGAPILKAVPLSPEQIDDCIDESCQYFGRFGGEEGNRDELCVIFTKPYDNHEPLLSSADTRLIKNNDYLNNPTATTNVISAGVGSILVYKQEYQLPRNVIAVKDIVHSGGGNRFGGNNQGASDNDQSIMDVGVWGSVMGGAVGGIIGGIGGNSMATASGLFCPANAPGFGQFGTRGGVRAAGGGLDLISFTLGMQYLDMVHQLFTIKMRMEFLAQQRKVRFSPAPPCAGVIVIAVTAMVEDEWLYESLWVRNYALAKCKKQIAANLMLYDGASFPGGVKLNFEKYDALADKEIEELKKEIDDNHYGTPFSGFLIG